MLVLKGEIPVLLINEENILNMYLMEWLGLDGIAKYSFLRLLQCATFSCALVIERRKSVELYFVVWDGTIFAPLLALLPKIDGIIVCSFYRYVAEQTHEVTY